DEMTGIEVRRGELAFDLRSPEIRPALERHAFDEVGPVADGVDIGPGADVIRADLGLGDQILRVRDLGEIELLVETIVGIEPADVRRRERDVALGITLASFSLFSRSIVPPVMYSTGTPVVAVNFLPMRLSTMSRQLPPHTLTTSLSWALACIGARNRAKNRANAASAMQIRFMLLPFPFARRSV